ncbi:MAG TPA: HAMP domain-containing histidine kinase [Candidatus Scatomorpha gallistercoris]|nr:HAMP domain-containing histidine kinase [Candidatus Scatomorpha gallistercoris]
MRFLTIKTRVTIYFTLMMLLIVGLVIGVILIAGRGVISDTAEGTLLDVVHDEIDDVEFDDGYLDLDELDFYRHNVYVQAYDASGLLLGGAGPSDFDGAAEFHNGEIRSVSVDNQPWLVYDLYLADSNGGVWLRGITSADNNFSAARVITILALIILPVLVVITAVIGWLIARHAFKPVRQITDTVDAINDGDDLSARIGLHRGRDEIHRLAATFDSMFDRLELSFNAEKRFASDASHELRTPVSIILAECEYARANAQTVEDYQESLDVVERQGRRMSGLINQLLNITRMDQGTQAISREEADFSELVDVVTDEAVRASGKDFTVKKHIEPGVTANIDVGLMSRLVQNLVENACKYTPDGGKITVSLHAAGGRATLTVSDTGIGIAKRDLGHIWERFWQADSSRGVDRGSGLGLAMVKQIADAHGGKLSVESEPGQGSSFSYSMEC